MKTNQCSQKKKQTKKTLTRLSAVAHTKAAHLNSCVYYIPIYLYMDLSKCMCVALLKVYNNIKYLGNKNQSTVCDACERN